jgi:diguanylate cyclase (GGDEF)-like protein/putative nucleotidyltransferase with HDIG domain
MNIYAIAPLLGTIAYIPLLLITLSSRPWQKRHTLFVLFLVSAMVWSGLDYVYRANFFPGLEDTLFRIVIISFFTMTVQFHCFATSFYPHGQKHLIAPAYISLLIAVILISLGYVTGSVTINDNFAHGFYKTLIIVPGTFLVLLVLWNLYVFRKMLKTMADPVSRNHIIAIMLGILVLTFFTVLSLPSIFRAFPLSHYGNLINAFLLSYAVIRHRLVDIKLVIKRGTVWAIVCVLGIATYWLLLIVAQKVFDFELDIYASIVASVLAVGLAILIYFIRGRLFNMMSRAFQGSSYNAQQKLHEFTVKIHNVFSLKEQGGELLILLVKALNIKQACLLFPEADTGDLITQFYEPKDDNNRLANFRLRSNNPIVKYLEKEKKYLPKESLAILPSFLSLWPQEREEIDAKNISMFIPLISRERLIAILILGEKRSGRYSLEDLNNIENVTSRVAVSMEKEYLREQLREREEELSVINNSSVILSSSLDIQEIFGNFVEELKKVVNINWAGIVLIDEDEFVCVALSSPEISAYQIGDRVPMERTGTAWVVSQKKAFVESDLALERYFTTSEFFYNQGLRSTAYLPLIAKGKIIGSFILVSKTPHAFSQRHVRLLEQLASQIAMPLENSQLYARAEKKARIDELTGLYNRRSLDEMIDSEISRHSRYGGAFSLAILDLDSFKAYNDTYGHLAGDGLLKTVGSNIKAAIRTSDYAFRYGGDEFAVLLPQTSIDAALNVLERVHEKIGDGIDATKINITASIGVACWPDDGISHTDIIASADVTLYRAKRSGRNQTLCASGPLSGLTLAGAAEQSGSNIDAKLSGIINAFSEMVDSRSYYTVKHSKKVTDYALALAKVLGLDKEETLKVETCALLHDVGKMAISSELLSKSGELTEDEWEIIKTHPRLGAEMIKVIPQLAYSIEPVLHHHEKFDGSGYPDGQKGENIPIISRILAIANEFVVMTSDRSYSETITHENALEELKRRAGTYFDPYLVERFVSIFETKTNGNKKKARRESGLGPSSYA